MAAAFHQTTLRRPSYLRTQCICMPSGGCLMASQFERSSVAIRKTGGRRAVTEATLYCYPLDGTSATTGQLQQQQQQQQNNRIIHILLEVAERIAASQTCRSERRRVIECDESLSVTAIAVPSSPSCHFIFLHRFTSTLIIRSFITLSLTAQNPHFSPIIPTTDPLFHQH